MTTTNATEGKATRSFLSLPGGKRSCCYLQIIHANLFVEIRNRIYDFAEEKENVSLVLRKGADAAQPTLDEGGAPKRQFFGLTQVSRQVRAEYLPLYRARTKIGINHVEVNKYIDEVLRVPGEQDKDLVSNVVLRFNHRPLRDQGSDVSLDLLPLLRLGCAANNFHLDCASEAFHHYDQGKPSRHQVRGVKEAYVSLMQAVADRTTRRCLDDVVSGVWVQWDGADNSIYVHIWRQAWGWWMEAYGRVLNDEDGRQHMHVWQRKLGLSLPLGRGIRLWRSKIWLG